MAKQLVEIGVMGVGISIDSLDPQKHNAFRGVPGAWEAAVAGIEASKRNGLQFQVHFSAQPMNYQELPAVVEWAHGLGARVLNVFFMVCTGRGEELTDITPAQYEEVLGYLVNCQDNYKGMLVRARCAPHFKRLAYEKDPNSPITKATGYMGGGCLAGTNYARVTPNGELTPCPYMPLSAGNVRENSFVDLWEKSDIFNSFRYPQLKGKCGDCEYSDICGGCRARPYVAATLARRPVSHTPKGGEDQGRVQCRGSVHRAMDDCRAGAVFSPAMAKKVWRNMRRTYHDRDDRAYGRTWKKRRQHAPVFKF
jgi:radical SAM protein with 4Fe4S-binding SPASM domain